jgi:hypothetical protein
MSTSTAASTPRPQSQNQANKFSSGWYKLPDELKLHVLRYALPVDQHYTYQDFNRSLRYAGMQHDHFETAVFPFLACPRLSSLASEYLYSHNTIQLWPTFPKPTFLPYVAMRHCIRNLYVHVKRDINDFEFLAKLADGSTAFQRLRDLEINIGLPPYNARGKFYEFYSTMDPIQFDAKVLRVRYEHDRVPHRLTPVRFRDAMETYIFDKLTLQCPLGKRLRLSWTRWFSSDYISDAEDNRKYVNTFHPTNWSAFWRRTTVKTVEIENIGK